MSVPLVATKLAAAESRQALGSCPWVSARRWRSPHESRIVRSPTSLTSLSTGGRRGTARCNAQRNDSAQVSPGIFPAGRKQASVSIPALFIECTADEVLDDAETAGTLDEAIQAGATAVVLGDPMGAQGGARLYEAAVQLKTLLRGRATLLVRDRADMANAAEADGLVLNAGGVPVVVARRMMAGAGVLVGATCRTVDAVATAAADGANVVLLTDTSATSIADARRAQRAASIPVVVQVDAVAVAEEVCAATQVDGVALPLSSVRQDTSAVVRRLLARIEDSGAPQPLPSSVDFFGHESDPTRARIADADAASTGFRPGRGQLLSDETEALVVREKRTLGTVQEVLQAACPAMQELALLRDALLQLDELFLVVVVGEFNSGKSSVINALLGGSFLPTGILPTTNEINVLKYASEEDAAVTQEADGLYVRTIPAELLKELSVVDTPGTNVILGRQQRLTEEFVPRADLVLFVLSADRPFTESEVTFLRYIRQWGKKVVFVVNKVDQLGGEQEVQQVVQFVSENAASILGVRDSAVIPVSARKALAAKNAVRDSDGESSGVLSTVDVDELRTSEEWAESRFERLEQFLVVFLGGQGGGGEVVRLKLQTPISVALALLEAAERQIAGQLRAVEGDLAGVEGVRKNIRAFWDSMAEDSGVQVDRVMEAIEGMYQCLEDAVDDVLQIQAWGKAAQYLLGTNDPSALPIARALKGQVFGGAVDQVEAVAAEHTDFVRENSLQQLQNYQAWARARAENWGIELPPADVPAELRPESSPREGPNALARGIVSAIREFDQEAAVVELEAGTKEAVVTTATYLGGAVAGVFLLTSIMQTGMEDFLSLCLCAAAAYAGIITLPLRRAKVKASARGQIQGIKDRVAGLMAEELETGVSAVERALEKALRPVEERAQLEKQRVEELQEMLREAKIQVEKLQDDVNRIQ